MVNKPSNRLKFIFHGFFYTGAISVAEPSTILPLIVSYFTSNNLIIGLYSSLLRGGAILMQLFAAFHAQTYPKVINYLRFLFIFRFISWASIGASLYFFGTTNSIAALIGVGIGLFSFSFMSGFSTVYFGELLGKSFTSEYRGKTMAIRQFFSGFSAILSGFISAWFLGHYDKPLSFSYLFMFSCILMVLCYVSLGIVSEEPKQNVSCKEKNFLKFLGNSFTYIQKDKRLKYQIITMLFSYSYLFALPFIVIHIKNDISAALAGIFVVVQMSGAMLSNVLWGYLSGKNKNKTIIQISFICIIIALIISFFPYHFWLFSFLFFLAGAATDGFRLAYNNLVLIIAPEDKRPVYVAVQNNITSLGLFFSVPGGLILNFLGFPVLVIFSVLMLFIGFVLVFKI